MNGREADRALKALKARIQVRRGTYRGQPGWHILGKDASGGSVRIFSISEEEARRMAGEIRAGKEPHFDQTLERSASQIECDNCVEVARARVRHECFCTPEQRAAKEAPVREVMRTLQELADMLRETAKGLRDYQRNDFRDGVRHGINAWHAANRLEKWAERIDSSTSKGESK